MSKRAHSRRIRTALVAVVFGATAVAGSGSAAFAAEIRTAAPVGKSASVQKAVQKKTVQKKAVAKKAVAKKATRTKAVQKKAGARAWARPVQGYALSATYGKGGGMWAQKHSGQDFAVPVGTAVKAAGPGIVVKAGPNGGGDGPAYGNAIVVRHADRTYSQYAHLSRLQVKPGQRVAAGQRIALSGNTGNSSGPHLHFEIRTTANYGSAINPVAYLRSVGVRV
ncbi:M23 family metallopeptidase [Streptomyces candidus]|uniref:Murein DD-endopeptidase MepM/ murein hydrolase activator NlpD n=1 Tax=Streptomyces candidus TaxID=67283 RepID=A0A7X0HKC4_9ACTN|nr:M23 family metallopeptidase [Streptomyces candidus]MBB6437959.1 murein DD-endopeptidase MepM/ murein hydrolase activator NlpD [Streptomyces candidus]GHH39849.1 peptidase [Streptomyces candidus]